MSSSTHDPNWVGGLLPDYTEILLGNANLGGISPGEVDIEPASRSMYCYTPETMGQPPNMPTFSESFSPTPIGGVSSHLYGHGEFGQNDFWVPSFETINHQKSNIQQLHNVKRVHEIKNVRTPSSTCAAKGPDLLSSLVRNYTPELSLDRPNRPTFASDQTTMNFQYPFSSCDERTMTQEIDLLIEEMGDRGILAGLELETVSPDVDSMLPSLQTTASLSMDSDEISFPAFQQVQVGDVSSSQESCGKANVIQFMLNPNEKEEEFFHGLAHNGIGTSHTVLSTPPPKDKIQVEPLKPAVKAKDSQLRGHPAVSKPCWEKVPPPKNPSLLSEGSYLGASNREDPSMSLKKVPRRKSVRNYKDVAQNRHPLLPTALSPQESSEEKRKKNNLASEKSRNKRKMMEAKMKEDCKVLEERSKRLKAILAKLETGCKVVIRMLAAKQCG